MLNLVKQLEELSPRIGKREKPAAALIKNALEGIEIKEQSFKNELPDGKSKLLVDGIEILSVSSSFCSGTIDDDKALVSSIHTSPQFFKKPNINFNPYCKEMSLPTFYFYPSIAILRSDVQKVLEAETISGSVKVKKQSFSSTNLLVGNTKNPENIIFAHYDTVMKGAVDNSGSIAMLISLIKNNSGVLSKSLFVFGGSEEFSLDEPIYWGRGYRVFEEEYPSLLECAKKIIVSDGIGLAKPIFCNEFLLESLPLKNLEKWKTKTNLLVSDTAKINTLWSIYHSKLDTVNMLREEYLENAKKLLVGKLRE